MFRAEGTAWPKHRYLYLLVKSGMVLSNIRPKSGMVQIKVRAECGMVLSNGIAKSGMVQSLI